MQRGCRGADEGDAVGLARLGEQRVLGEEAVAGVDRVGAALDGHPHDVLVVEVGPDRVALLADLVGLVGLEPVLGPAVLVREDGDRPRAELGGRPERPDGDLATVGDEDLGEHGGDLPVGVGTSPGGGAGFVQPSDVGTRLARACPPCGRATSCGSEGCSRHARPAAMAQTHTN